MFDSATPCIVELFGHNQIAGNVTEQTVGGSAFIRVDVPAVEDQQAFTKFYGPGAIYAITPTDEATMLKAVRAFRVVPVDRYSLSRADEPRRLPPGRIDDDDDLSDEEVIREMLDTDDVPF